MHQQRNWKEKQIAELETEERKLRPIEQAVSEVQVAWRELFETPPSLSRELARVSDLPELQKQLADNIAKLKGIDRAQFDEMEERRASLATNVKKDDEELRVLLGNQRHKDVQIAESLLAAAVKAAAEARSNFDTIRHAYDFSLWHSRIDELRKQVLGEFPSFDVAATRFRSRWNEHDRQALEARGDLHEQRSIFIRTWPKFDDLPPHAEDNVAF